MGPPRRRRWPRRPGRSRGEGQGGQAAAHEGAQEAPGGEFDGRCQARREPGELAFAHAHVHHHVHSHHHVGEDSGEEGADPQRFLAERVHQSTEGLYPSEHGTGPFGSEMMSQSLIYPSEREEVSMYRSVDYESGQETARFSSEKKMEVAKSATLPRLPSKPTLAPPSEMRRSPSH